MSRKHKRQSLGSYVAVPQYITKTEAWRAMSLSARLVWIELRAWLKKEWTNNGQIFRSCRSAAKAIGINRNTIHQAYLELEHFGFLVRTREGFLGSEGFGNAARFRFTDLPYDGHLPTRDYEKWSGELFVYTPHRRQKPVPKNRTPCPEKQDRVEPPGATSLCPEKQDRAEPSACPEKQDRYSLPLPGGQLQQGSSTARAPAQAGGAGSSPAPVASLTEYVLSVVNAELDRMEERKGRLQ